MARVWIQGAGELASGVAVALLADGHDVVLAEVAAPLAVRRLVCFSEAVFEGRTEVAGYAGVLARRIDPSAAARGRARILVDASGSAIPDWQPTVVVDARMTKRAPAPLPLDGIPLVGLGPGFTAGADADLVIETHRPAGPGRVLSTGSAAADTGVPGEVGGENARRLLRSPADGRLVPLREIGDLVRAGEAVATVAGEPVISLLDGMLRGLVHPRAELFRGVKVGDVDPRGPAVDPAAQTDKAQAIGRGVREALVRLGIVGAA